MPPSPTYPIHIFQAYGVELEYMIVDSETLGVRPIADRLLETVSGEQVNEVECGALAWSNELMLHVIELKTNGPARSLAPLAAEFQKQVREINAKLADSGAMLMPTAAHPMMNPLTDSKIWPHELNEIYHSYNRIFDCRGHGWANLQSTHINLPFGNDEEFSRLHTAIRLLLPILPALAASSPVIDGNVTGLLDTRLEYYRNNQGRIPVISGKVIPEVVDSYEQYQERILLPIYSAIAPHDTLNVLQEEWLNSRGAIARFERGTIEIRVLDIQECPAVDLAIVQLVAETLKAVADDHWASLDEQKSISENDLFPIFMDTIAYGSQTVIKDKAFLRLFGVTERIKACDLWQEIVQSILPERNPPGEQWPNIIDVILHEGTLAERILEALGRQTDKKHIVEVYRRLCENLANGEMFLV